MGGGGGSSNPKVSPFVSAILGKFHLFYLLNDCLFYLSHHFFFFLFLFTLVWVCLTSPAIFEH